MEGEGSFEPGWQDEMNYTCPGRKLRNGGLSEKKRRHEKRRKMGLGWHIPTDAQGTHGLGVNNSHRCKKDVDLSPGEKEKKIGQKLRERT